MSLAVSMVFAAKEKVSAFKGTVTKIDRGARTAVVKTADGAEHTVHFVGRTLVHGAEKSPAGAEDAFHGLREGSSVVVHNTAKGTEETAEEVDRIGNDGLRLTEGTVSKIDRSGKAITIRTAGGAEETYKLADHAAEDAGKDIGSAAEKSGKVTVYYTEESGRKVAHFFEKAL
jgi:arginine repressor